MMGLPENGNLSTFLTLKSPVLNFLNSLSSQALLSYKPPSYKKTCKRGYPKQKFPKLFPKASSLFNVNTA